MTLVKSRARQAWIESSAFDSALIVGPPLLACVIVILLNTRIPARHTVGPLAWLLLVVCIDVAHVYSSFFRTYWDSSMKNRSLLWLVPLFCWVIGALFYSIAPTFFWTALAYVAVFHFIRQQYGFAMIYARNEKGRPKLFRWIDQVTIYAATLYPLVFWHSHLPRNFNWFIDGDFIDFVSPEVSRAAGWLYGFILTAYLMKEIFVLRRSQVFNIPKNLLIGTTVASWYIGIVWLNNDMAFTLTNVVSHGIPYIALIWLYGRKNLGSESKGLTQSFFSLKMLPAYVGILIIFAYLEEGLWDGFIWRDHSAFFPHFTGLPIVQDRMMLAFLVPILALPQSTHYIFDAFLWRVRGPHSDWKKVLFPTGETR